MISDNYEIKMVVFKNLANEIRKQAKIYRPKTSEKEIEEEGDSN